MTVPEVVQLGREVMLTAVLLAAPIIIASLVVGLTISLFQTVTSIQEQTLSFAPRIVVVALVIALTLPWTIEVLMNFTHRMIWQMGESGP